MKKVQHLQRLVAGMELNALVEVLVKAVVWRGRQCGFSEKNQKKFYNLTISMWFFAAQAVKSQKSRCCNLIALHRTRLSQPLWTPLETKETWVARRGSQNTNEKMTDIAKEIGTFISKVQKELESQNLKKTSACLNGCHLWNLALDIS